MTKHWIKEFDPKCPGNWTFSVHVDYYPGASRWFKFGRGFNSWQLGFGWKIYLNFCIAVSAK